MNAARRFTAFVLVGGLSAAVNVLARVGFSLLVPYPAAIALAFPVGLTFAFVLNRTYVFEARGNGAHQFARFALVNLVALAQIWTLSVVLARWVLPGIGAVWEPELVAHAIGVASPVLTSYIAHKRYTFSA